MKKLTETEGQYIWLHEFYELEDKTKSRSYDNYDSKRSAVAILKCTGKIKHGLYEATVIDIVSKEEFRVMGTLSEYTQQYRIGQKIQLRQHREQPICREWQWWKKDNPPRSSFSDHHHHFWYDPRYRDTFQGERYELLQYEAQCVNYKIDDVTKYTTMELIPISNR